MTDKPTPTPTPTKVEPPTNDPAKAKPAAPIQFGPSASPPGSRLKKR
jgi:hypothetical protein